MTHPMFPIPPALAKTAHITAARYKEMYARSVSDPEGFWGEIAEDFVWKKKWTRVKNTHFVGDVSIKWFEGAQINITENCIDRHAEKTPDKTAILWEGDDAREVRRISYAELLQEVCRLANALKSLGVKKGARVTIYMPMVPEAAFAMLACARIGAIHSVIFGGFSADAIRNRIEDAQSDFIITANEGLRGGKRIPLKANVDAAIAEIKNSNFSTAVPPQSLLPQGGRRLDEGAATSGRNVESPSPNLSPVGGEGYSGSPSLELNSSPGANVRHVLVLRRTDAATSMTEERDIWWDNIVPNQKNICPPTPVDAEDPLFILYTSGSTGKPKGMLHTTAGYMVYVYAAT